MANSSDTIFASITGGAGSAVNLVRVSGDKAKAVISFLCKNEVLNKPRCLVLSSFAQGLDTGLVSFFPGPNSYTGEDVAEFHLHGSFFVEKRFFEELEKLGARAALPGEFSYRAFENGKIDLTQAEAVADLIASQTEAQHRLAARQLSGVLSKAVEQVAEPARNVLSELEAWIDFPEEELSGITLTKWGKSIGDVKASISRHLELFEGGRIARDGYEVVLFGLPNVGKSSLLNALAKEERAIVTDIAGTTRDSIEVNIDIGGYLVRVWDTAGIREKGSDKVEELGIERTRKHIASADFKILVTETGSKVDKELECLADLVVFNKCDLEGGGSEAEIYVSALTGQGVEKLRARVLEQVKSISSGSGVLTNERHKHNFSAAFAYLSNFEQLLQAGAELEILSVELRSALAALDEIVGATSTEDILGRIFSSFCIGK